MEAYGKAVEAAPNWGDARFKLGNTLFKNDQLERALQAFQRNIDLNPNMRLFRQRIMGGWRPVF